MYMLTEDGRLFLDAELLMAEETNISKKELAVSLYPLMQQLEWTRGQQLLALQKLCFLTPDGASTYLSNLRPETGIWSHLVA